MNKKNYTTPIIEIININNNDIIVTSGEEVEAKITDPEIEDF